MRTDNSSLSDLHLILIYFLVYIDVIVYIYCQGLYFVFESQGMAENYSQELGKFLMDKPSLLWFFLFTK